MAPTVSMQLQECRTSSKALVALPRSGERDDCLDLDRHAERQLVGADR